ncbi:MAG: hypothetical protein ACSHXB_16270 [Sulfitobacter sp.]
MNSYFKQRAISYFSKRFETREGSEELLSKIAEFEATKFADPDADSPLILGLILDNRRFTLQLNQVSERTLEFFPEMDWEGKNIYAINAMIQWIDDDLDRVENMIFDWLVKRVQFSEIEERYGPSSGEGRS